MAPDPSNIPYSNIDAWLNALRLLVLKYAVGARGVK
jgi:hypothetical protein